MRPAIGRNSSRPAPDETRRIAGAARIGYTARHPDLPIPKRSIPSTGEADTRVQIAHNVTMLCTGLIGMFYTMTLHGNRGRDCAASAYCARSIASRPLRKSGHPQRHDDMAAAINDPATDTVVIGLPNYQHLRR